MLCSISGKSSSNWLHRLRSSKGFPPSSDDDLDLEQFLAHHIHDDPIPPNPEQSDANPISELGLAQVDPPAEIQNPSDGKQLFSMVSNVLAELFIMGDSFNNSLPKSKANKCSRKQSNPRFCVPVNSSHLSNNYDDNNDSASPVSDDNSGVGLCGDQKVKMVENVNCYEEEEKGYGNLSGFSRTEVTVIDTSFARWKFEKMLFRKKNVWRVRDNKGGKMINCGKKKRKSSNSNVCGSEVKKPKVSDGQCCLSEKGTEGELKDEYYQNNKLQSFSRNIPDTFAKALKNRNLENKNSSVVLIKNIPTGKKIGTSIPRSWSKFNSKITESIIYKLAFQKL